MTSPVATGRVSRALWVVANVCGVSAWLYLASTLWPMPPYEHCDFGPGDPFVFFLAVLPLFGLAAFAQLVALAFAIRRGIRTKRWTALALVVITTSGWAAAAAYDYHQGQRIVTEDCPSALSGSAGSNTKPQVRMITDGIVNDSTFDALDAWLGATRHC